eukprot:Blabericola_migrator_1__3505@NODE_203_length_11435_cov_141_633445_g174_i0_p2_GENE_NODE_203_length_11435_cov_141_633445_g174_i0NODE_203_length_11435_cov_141_633445_g174_i0_p2_ORF_typecomplete_len674_score144_36DNA_pol_A_exo1/PF01612_20/2_2e28Mut7C/PF01927_16/0_18_NODE_203_length_11435_cov_141_633445_g174_i0941311188
MLPPRTVVDLLIGVGQLKPAKTMARRFGFSLTTFPALLEEAYRASFSHWCFSEKMSLDETALLCAQDREALAAFLKWVPSNFGDVKARAIAMGLESERERNVWFKRHELKPVSPQEAHREFYKDKIKFVPSELAKLEIGYTVLPEKIQELIGPKEESKAESKEESKKKWVTLDSLGLPLEYIQLVDTWSRFCAILPEIENSRVIGVDCEWRPSLTGEHIYPVALVQIAFRNSRGHLQCYLIDLYTLRQEGDEDLVLQHLDAIFWSEDILKVGCRFNTHDLQMLKKTAGESGYCSKLVNYLDVETIARAVGDPHFQGGLARAVTEVMKCEMDKTQQCANWEIRPLTLPQAIYAALDAAICVVLQEKSGIEKGYNTKENDAAATNTAVIKTEKPTPKTKSETTKTDAVKTDVKETHSPIKLLSWIQEKNKFLIQEGPIPNGPVFMFDGLSQMAKILRSFGFKVGSLEKKDWVKAAEYCQRHEAIAMIGAHDIKALTAAMEKHPEVSSIKYFLFEQGSPQQRTQKIIWLLGCEALQNPVPCLKCGDQLRPASEICCSCQKCESFFYKPQIDWYTNRNKREYEILMTNIDCLANE